MVALDIQEKGGESQAEILRKVDRCMASYLRSFGMDGACEEGVTIGHMDLVIIFILQKSTNKFMMMTAICWVIK